MGTELDPDTQAKLDRGYRMVELLKQGKYEPLGVVDQVMVIFAGTRGHLDYVAVEHVREWETKFLTFMKDQKPEIRDELGEKLDLDDDLIAKIEAALKEFATQFQPGSVSASTPAEDPEPAIA